MNAKFLQLLVTLVLTAGVAACATRPIPLSAQAGSTIVIPLMGGSNAVVGYGSSTAPFTYTDHQRGAMVYQLDGPGGFELHTRFSIAAETHFASPLAGMARISSPWPFGYSPQILSVVNIPADAPEGTHLLHVIRRLPDGTIVDPDLGYGGHIQILPHSIPVNGGAETIVGAPTPGSDPSCSIWCSGPNVSDAIPRPQIRIDLGGGTIGAFEMQLTYPANVIDIVGAAEDAGFDRAPNHAPILWIDDDGQGIAQISGVAHPEAEGLGNWALHVVFELDNGSAEILDLGDIGVGALTAYNLNGNPIPAPTYNIVGIR